MKNKYLFVHGTMAGMVFRLLAVFAFVIGLAQPISAQQTGVYIQVEARTSLASARDSVRKFSRQFDNVNGFVLGGGWYGIALGPFSRREADTLLRQYRRSGAIPADSYIEFQRSYRNQFWPVGAGVGGSAEPAEPATPVAEPAADPVQPDTPVADAPADADTAPQPAPEPEVVDETPRQARASEAELTRTQREELQIALKWAGVYTAAIDGAYGRGTRNAMAEWQRQNGYEPTGILTTLQRAALLGQYYAILEGMDMQQVDDPRTGISMQIPKGVVAFERYEAPFSVYNATGDLAVRVLQISQPGDRQTMNGLYEILQTLEIVPIDGPRERRNNGFSLTGENARIVSHTEVTLQNNQIKGFTLIWPAGDEERRERVLGLMKASFERTDGILDPATVTDSGQTVDLVSGLRIRKPLRSASGFFVDGKGTVVTSSAVIGSCSRITLNGVHEAEVVSSDADLGLAVLRARDALAPRGVAAFRASGLRLQSEVAVAGFSFGGRLSAPSLTYGRLEDLQGLSGEDGLKRLALNALPGDAGGPVFDTGGAVVGMLLPREDNTARRLPEDVQFSTKSEQIIAFLNTAGVRTSANDTSATMAPEDLTAQAAEMTVLIGCWE